MIVLFFSILLAFFVCKLIIKVYPEVFKHAAISAAIVVVITGGIKWKNHVATFNSDNEAVKMLSNAVTTGNDVVWSMADSMRAAADDEEASKVRNDQINVAAEAIDGTSARIRSYGHLFDNIPYISDMWKVDKKAKKELNARSQEIANNYMQNWSTYNGSVQTNNSGN